MNIVDIHTYTLYLSITLMNSIDQKLLAKYNEYHNTKKVGWDLIEQIEKSDKHILDKVLTSLKLEEKNRSLKKLSNLGVDVPRLIVEEEANHVKSNYFEVIKSYGVKVQDLESFIRKLKLENLER